MGTRQAAAVMVAIALAVMMTASAVGASDILVSHNLGQAAYSASSSYDSGYLPHLAFDGLTTSGWNAGDFYGWIEVDLGRVFELSKISLSCFSSGQQTHEIRYSLAAIGSSGSYTLATVSGQTSFLHTFSPGTKAQYIQVRTTSSPDWTNWNEIRVYSPSCIVTGTVSSTANGLDAVAGVTIAAPNGRYSTATNTSGVYSKVIPAGDITLMATKTGYLTAFGSVVAQANDTVTLDFDLKSVVSVDKIRETRTLADGTGVSLTQVAATSGSGTFTDGSYYVEDTDRTSGIRIVPAEGADAVNIGDRANFSGVMSTVAATGERFVDQAFVQNKVVGTPVRPLGTANRSVVEQGMSLSGLLTTVWGKVTYKDPTRAFMYVDDGSNADDGSGYVGLKVILDETSDAVVSVAAAPNEYAAVTGIVQPASLAGAFKIRAIRVRNYTNVQVVGETIVLPAQIPGKLSFDDVVPGTVVVRSTYLPGQPSTITYELGLDYVVDNAQGTIARTATSRIPDFSTNVLYGQHNFDHSQFPGYGNGPFIVFVDYQTTNGRPFAIPTDQSALLTKTSAKLSAGGPFKIIAFGDSITAGGEASSVALRYPNRYAQSLQARFPQAQIVMENGATGGDTSSDGLARLQEKVLSRSPDLVLVAFGMNDHNILPIGVPVGTFEQNLTTMVNSIVANTGAEVILISTFPPNPEWAFGSHQMNLYAAATQRVAANRHCAYADLYSVWTMVTQRKDSPSLLNNNINHPADFGHWLYLQALEAVEF